eukprot:jgi/Chrzof1/9218/Cz03g40100.t1
MMPAAALACVRVEPEIFRFNGVYRLIYYYCGCSSDYGGVVAMEVIRVEPLMVVVVDCWWVWWLWDYTLVVIY